MPARLANKRAIIELGYPFEQEGDTIIILKALAKEHIDEIIKISKEMNAKGESRTTYVIEAPPPAPQPEVVERRTEIIVSPPPPPEMPPSIRDWDDGHSTVKAGSVLGSRSHKGGHSTHGGHSVAGKSSHGGKSTHGGRSTHGGHSVRSRSHHGGHSKHRSHSSSSSSSSSSPPPPPVVEIVRSPSRSRRRSRSTAASHKEVIIEDVGESNAIGSVPQMQLVVPHRSKSSHRDERNIKAEIRALEAEKKALKYEREIEKEDKKAHRYRDRDGEVIIERDRDRGEPVKIEKDRKVPRLYHVLHSGKNGLQKPPPINRSTKPTPPNSAKKGDVPARTKAKPAPAVAGGDVRLTQCPRCKRFADKYVEHDYVVLFIDLVLVKPQVYRHLLFNRLGRDDDELDPSILRLGILLLLFDVYLTWSRIELLPHMTASSPVPRLPILLQYAFYLLLCAGMTVVQHLTIRWLAHIAGLGARSQYEESEMRYEAQDDAAVRSTPNGISTALFVSSCMKLFPILMV
ncbi:MAG: hypothetical protein Q9180_004080, partial [Flavoplaca navasiana]